MKKLDEINPNFLNCSFNYEESNNYSKYALLRYQERVVSLRKTPKYYFVLLKGVTQFFGYKFQLEAKKVKRCLDMKIFLNHKGRVFDKKEFNLFRKQLILVNPDLIFLIETFLNNILYRLD